MAKPIPKKFKSRPVSGVSFPKTTKPRVENRLWLGIDLSLNSLAISGLGYDGVTRKFVGPGFNLVRWNKHDHYFTRLKECSKAHDLIHELCSEMKILVELDQTYIVQEEPWPMGLVGKSHSQTLKQQAEMSGALLSGLVRYGYKNVYQVNSKTWQKMVAESLGITTHYSKWGKGLQGKLRMKEWAMEKKKDKHWPFPKEIPIWPDLIMDSENGGLKPKPESSKAQAKQPDDRYDAMALAEYGRRHIFEA